jgi:hypothetical protein
MLRPVADLDFVSVFNLCDVLSTKRLTSTLNDKVNYFLFIF